MLTYLILGAAPLKAVFVQGGANVQPGHLPGFSQHRLFKPAN
jgi:hypothetical protein